MTSDTDALERQLHDDLSTLGERLVDEELAGDLYRALTNRTWRKDGGAPGHVSLSWRRAEELVNELRGAHDREPMVLAQTGGEGEVSELAGDELARLGWHSAPLDTGRHDDAHVSSPPSPPPPGHGEREAPGGGSDWEQRAHEEASANRRDEAS